MAKTILLADDSITIQKIVNLTFSGEGIDVVTVGNGEAALRKINEIHPDVILADIFMPGKNGYEVCEQIKNSPNLQHIPVILLVGAFEPFDGNEAIRVKADGHLTKPFEIKVLISAVNSLISSQVETEAQEVEKEAVAEAGVVHAEVPPRAPDVTEIPSSAVVVEPPMAPEEELQERIEEQVEAEAGSAPSQVEEQPHERMGTEAATEEAPIEPPTAVEPEGETKVEVEGKPLAAEGVAEPSVPLEPFAPETAAPVPLEAEPVQEPEMEPSTSAVETVAEELATTGTATTVEDTVEEAVGIVEEEAAEVPVAVTARTEEVHEAENVPPAVIAREATSREEFPPIELEETDPLGLYAADSLFAPIPPVVHESTAIGTKSLVVDIWETKGTLAQTDDVLPELAVEAGVSAGTVVAEDFSPALEAEHAAHEVLPAVESIVKEPGEAAPAPIPVPEIPMRQEPVVSAPPSPGQAEPLGQPAPAPAVLGLEDPALVEHIVNEVVEKLSKDAIEKIAWEVVPDLAELMIKEYVQSHFSNREGR